MSLTLILIVLSLVGLGTLVAFGRAIMGKTRVIKKRIILYSTLVFTAFGGISAGSAYTVEFDPWSAYTLLQLVFFMLGIVNAFLIINYFFSKAKNPMALESLFTACITVIGAIVMLVLLETMPNMGGKISLATAILGFPLPYLAYRTITSGVEIPSPEYHTWVYPLSKDDQPVINPAGINEEYTIITLKISNKHDAPTLSNMTLRAPNKLPFGDVIFAWVTEYNRRTEEKIMMSTKKGEPYKWQFEIRKNGRKKGAIINPKKHVIENKIDEKDVIIAKRVGKEKLPKQHKL